MSEFSLFEAVKNGDFEAVKQLVSEGVDVKQKDEKDRNALAIAVLDNQLEIASYLLENGALPDIGDGAFTASILMICTPQMRSLLLEKGLDPNLTSEFGPLLCFATSYNKPEMAKALLDAGADVNGADPHNQSALLFAAEKNDHKNVELLLSHGADMDLYSKFGSCPLLKAMEKGYEDLARLFIQKGANLNYRNVNGYTAIMFSLFKENYETLSLLLEKRANASIEDDLGRTPLSLAVKWNLSEAISIFSKYKHLLSEKDQELIETYV